MVDAFSLLLLSLVAILWGTTNALMKTGVEGIEKCGEKATSWYQRVWEEVKFLVTNWRYVSSYVVNQTGSLIFYYTLGYCDLSIAGPLTNTMTFVVTFFADGYFLKGRSDQRGSNLYQKAGLVLICAGVVCCLCA
ncbi:Transmembrane protein [Orchesella cincta]|uniref:Transmembrane protein n=1 Tax=Orchesella cincta TaxID=48709 RepID=A0A1D2N6V7_ORCCI|nr:Transmembrane protein [Orchesella cincta]